MAAVCRPPLRGANERFGFPFSLGKITLSAMKGIILAGGVRRWFIEHLPIHL
jgi:hypothetical protein